MSRYQRGHVYEAFSAFHVQYYQTELRDGQQIRVRRSHRLRGKDRVHYSATSKAVKKLCADFMSIVNEDVVVGEDMTIAFFWMKYLRYCEHEYKGRGMKPSTVRGFKQIWNQFLEGHFGKRTLQEYQADHARAFLASLKTTQVYSTRKHIRGLAGAMFSEAIERGLRKDVNPWRVKIPKDCKESEQTQRYTLEEVENLVSAPAIADTTTSGDSYASANCKSHECCAYAVSRSGPDHGGLGATSRGAGCASTGS